MSDNPTLDAELAKIVPHLRDVGLRDGIQAWDANMWKIENIVDVLKQENQLAVTARDTLGVKLAPAEVGGGWQVMQPAKMLYEDPFVNLEKIRDAAPDMDLQVLYRSKQAYGSRPVSDEVHRATIEATIKRGIKTFRVFDMMNDPANIDTAIQILKDYKDSHPDSGVKIEGAVTYINEPKDGKRAWTPDEYADYAVKLAEKGCDEILIKNFTGAGGGEMPTLIDVIRAKLDAAKFSDRKINLQMNGERAEDLRRALAPGDGHASIDKVDVAIGELGDGPSHTEMRTMIYALLPEGKFSKAEIDAHPFMKQLQKTESAISEVVHGKGMKDVSYGEAVESFDKRSGFMQTLKPEEVDRYPVSMGTLSDLWNRTLKDFDKYHKHWEKLEREENTKPGTRQHFDYPASKVEYFQRVMHNAQDLWNKAGRFNTVTTGGTLLIEQAIQVTNKQIENQPITMNDYTPDYMDVAAGRLGRNQGMDKRIGDTEWLKAVLAYKALAVLNKAIKEGKVERQQRDRILHKTGFGKPNMHVMIKGDGTVALDDPAIQEKLTIENYSVATGGLKVLQRFKAAIEEVKLPADVKARMLAELKTGPLPEPSGEIEQGRKLLADMEKQGIDVEMLRVQGKPISNREDLALLAALTRESDDRVMTNLLAHHAGVILNTPAAEPDKRIAGMLR